MKEILEKLKQFTKSQLFETITTVFFSFIVTAFIYLFIAIPNQVDGASMEESFHNGELILTNKFIQIVNEAGLSDEISYDYQRGDVIVFQQPGKPDFIKRIIAVGSEKIKIENGKVFINGNQLREDYIPDSTQYETKPAEEKYSFIKEGEELTVPENKYFVMGDNRMHSQDSRYNTVGFVDKKYIKGRVFFRYWPLQKFGLIQRGSYEEVQQ